MPLDRLQLQFPSKASTSAHVKVSTSAHVKVEPTRLEDGIDFYLGASVIGNERHAEGLRRAGTKLVD
jgi:hypothetical protein